MTRIASAAEHTKGVVRLCGFIDMHSMLTLEAPAHEQFTVVTILNMARRVMGMAVDSAPDVITLKQEPIKSAPAMSSVLDKRMSSTEAGLIKKSIA